VALNNTRHCPDAIIDKEATVEVSLADGRDAEETQDNREDNSTELEDSKKVDDGQDEVSDQQDTTI